LEKMLARSAIEIRSDSEALASFVKTKFKISDMADSVLAGYAEAIASRSDRGAAAASFALPSS
jgi:hypothetical protein